MVSMRNFTQPTRHTQDQKKINKTYINLINIYIHMTKLLVLINHFHHYKNNKTYLHIDFIPFSNTSFFSLSFHVVFIIRLVSSKLQSLLIPQLLINLGFLISFRLELLSLRKTWFAIWSFFIFFDDPQTNFDEPGRRGSFSTPHPSVTSLYEMVLGTLWQPRHIRLIMILWFYGQIFWGVWEGRYGNMRRVKRDVLFCTFVVSRIKIVVVGRWWWMNIGRWERWRIWKGKFLTKWI